MPSIPDESSPASYHNLASPPDHFGPRNPQSLAAHSRETSGVRGRAPDPSMLTSSTLQPQQLRRTDSHSKSPEPSAGRPGAAAYDVTLERRPSNSYGHHRQTSIVHGIQHSRNPSLAASSSPLSPELIASLGRNGGLDSENTGTGRPEQPGMHSYQSAGNNGTGHPAPRQLGTIDDQIANGAPNGSSANPLHRRMNSTGAQWRDRSHSRSQSKHHHPESKTVGEYALHHLFNSVSTASADTRPEADIRQVCGPCRQ